jgi:hypothetical protein
MACEADGPRLHFIVPEIADYEVRRELIRSTRLASLARLDWRKTTFTYAPITTPVMLLAASALGRRQINGPTRRR